MRGLEEWRSQVEAHGMPPDYAKTLSVMGENSGKDSKECVTDTIRQMTDPESMLSAEFVGEPTPSSEL